jgi:hypothetical protein
MSSTLTPSGSLEPKNASAVATLRSRISQPVRLEPSDIFSLPLRTREDVVKYLYARAEKAIQLAGHEEFRLNLRGLHTLEAEDFDQVHFSDLVTGIGGRQLRVEPRIRQLVVEPATTAGTETVERSMTFDLFWLKGADWRITQPWGRDTVKRLKGLTVGRALREAAKEDVDFPRIVAATTFEVEAEFNGETRVYRAALLWSSGSSLDERSFLWIDNVVLQIERAITHLPIRDRHHDLGAEIRQTQALLNSPAGNAITTDDICDPFFNSQEAPVSALGSNEEHISGGHGAIAQALFECSCDVRCASTCNSSWATFPSCGDTGDIQCCRTHKNSSSQDGATTIKEDATDGGATCSIGHGCVFRTCLIGNFLCTVSVSVTKKGGAVTISPSNATWNFSRVFSKTCGACRIYEPPDNCLVIGPEGRRENICDDPPDANAPEPTCQDHPVLCTPIVLDVGHDGFRFTGRNNTVEFDIDGNGATDRITWTDPGGNEVFLALDRNGNGTIDDGTELFGAATAQPESDDKNGFRALAVYDSPAEGGNGDGFISAEDAVFSELLLWRDISLDGVSQTAELSRLSASDMLRLSLEYVESRRRDRYGNQLRWAGWLETQGVTSLGAADVIFIHVGAEPSPRRSQPSPF